MHAAFSRFAGVVGLSSLVLLAGCTEAAELSPVGAEQTAPAGSVATVSLPAAGGLSVQSVSKLLQPELTQEAARRAWGDDYYSVQTGTYINGEWVDSDLWRYDAAPLGYAYNWKDGSGMIDFAGLAEGRVQAQLLLHWSRDGRLLYAVHYYQGSDGKLHSYLPALGALDASSSEANEWAKQHRLQIGAEVPVHHPTYTYDMIGAALPQPSFRAEPGTAYTLTAMNAQMAELDDQGRRGWVPVWYLTEEAAKAEAIRPLILEVAPGNADDAGGGTGAYWHPQAAQAAVKLQAGQTVYAFEQMSDWVAVAMPQPQTGEPSATLWVKRNDLRDGQSWSAPYAAGTEATSASPATAAAVSQVLHRGVSQERVRSVFGEPQQIERSGNRRSTGEPMLTVPVWRYQNEATELAVTWSPDGKLLDYSFVADTRGKPPLAAQPFDWRFQSDLAYNFLVGAAGEVLLIAGDDGGFSGMHYDSHLYAVNRDTGERIWKHDFGYDRHLFVLTADRKHVAFLSQQPEQTTENGSAYRLELMETATGNPVWSRDVPIRGNVWELDMTGADGVIALAYTTEQDGAKQTTLAAYSVTAGKPIWSKKLDKTGKMIQNHWTGPMLIVQTIGDQQAEAELAAYRPNNGSKAWTLQQREAIRAVEFQIVEDGRRLDAGNPTHLWTRSGQELIQVDLASGKTTARLPLYSSMRYVAVNDRYVFRVQNEDGGGVAAEGRKSSSWIDLHSGKTLWSVSGTIGAAVVQQDVVYFSLDGVVQAAKLADGQLLWRSDDMRADGQLVWYDGYLLAESRPEAVVLDARDGSALYRMSDVMTGSYDYFNDPMLVNGMVTVLDGKLYIGSANGLFSQIGGISRGAGD